MASIRALAQQPCQLLRKAYDVSAKPDEPYPPISSIPRMPESRMRAPPTTDTSVLYLAYGSNLCAETFLGVRGVRPISRINVSVPTLDLTFDLAGIPYVEPCFANTAPRKIPLPKPPKPPKLPPFHPPPQPSDVAGRGEEEEEEDKPPLGRQLTWTQGLVGVVYEVTPEDYANILATEGGGSSYADIIVPCLPIPPRMSVPEKPPIELPKPFFAHTLYAPAIPESFPPDPEDPDHGDDKANGRGHSLEDKPHQPDDDIRKKWYWRFLTRPLRKPPAYAQASARYLKLITDGAAEHELPDDYQRYLRSLHCFTVTTWRQRIGQAVLRLLVAMTYFIFIVAAGCGLADEKGHLPTWLTATIAVLFNVTWMTYDGVLKPLFGDGERTLGDDAGDGSDGGGTDSGSKLRKLRMRHYWRGQRSIHDEEKVGLLSEVEEADV